MALKTQQDTPSRGGSRTWKGGGGGGEAVIPRKARTNFLRLFF